MPEYEVWKDTKKGDMVKEKEAEPSTSDTIEYENTSLEPSVTTHSTESNSPNYLSNETESAQTQNDIVVPNTPQEDTMNQDKISTLIKEIIEELNEGLFEKEKAIRMTLLASLAGESIFMLGEPGTAKSLVARRVSEAFEEPDEKSGEVKFFDYLMNQFSQPDEIFGPVSINELKNDKYVRKTEGFLPNAQFAFLDEIWKANPAIQNTLLTILNEKIFRNGTQIKEVPLIGFMSASNELPESGMGLEAIFDRFLIRLYERPIIEEDNFRNMISAGRNIPTTIKNKISKELIKFILKESESVTISEECYEIINNVRKTITGKNDTINDEKEKFIVSDRRWKKIANLMRVSAYCNNRIETDIMDATLIADCIWNTILQEEESSNIVKEAIEQHGLKCNDISKDIEEKIIEFKQKVDDRFFIKYDNGGLVPKHDNPEDKKLIAEDFNKKEYKKLRNYIEKELSSVESIIEDCQTRLGSNIFSDNDTYLPRIESELITAKNNIIKQLNKLEEQRSRYEK